MAEMILQDLLTSIHRFEKKECFSADENMSIESELKAEMLDENDTMYILSDSDIDADDSVYCPEEKKSI